jgi:hypothetical protein
MTECAQIEIAAQLAVDAQQDIQIERPALTPSGSS